MSPTKWNLFSIFNIEFSFQYFQVYDSFHNLRIKTVFVLTYFIIFPMRKYFIEFMIQKVNKTMIDNFLQDFV